MAVGAAASKQASSKSRVMDSADAAMESEKASEVGDRIMSCQLVWDFHWTSTETGAMHQCACYVGCIIGGFRPPGLNFVLEYCRGFLAPASRSVLWTGSPPLEEYCQSKV